MILQTETATEKLAAFAKDMGWDDIPPSVRHEAKRSLLNYFATAIGGSAEPAVDRSLAALTRFSGPGDCRLIGRSERTDMALATFLNAIGANVFDFDDTHQETVIHPTAPVAPALFAQAETKPCQGRALLTAFIIGGEIECRLGNAVSPSHYTKGWHITATCGIFGAATGVGRLVGLTGEQLRWALGHAAAQTAGLVETLGTMSKSIGVGNAAKNGLLSAHLAQADISGPADPLTGERGFLTVFSEQPMAERLTRGLGETWEIAKNTYKPYPAGIVLHPVIEACIRLHREHGLRPEDVAKVELTAHPLLQQRADRPDVETGQLSQISAQHAIAIALRRGKAGLAEFSDGAVAETLQDGIRPEVLFIEEPDRAIETVKMRAQRHQGVALEIEIDAAKGGPQNPMSDRELEEKLAALADFRGFPRDVRAIADAVWSMDQAESAAEVMRLADWPD